MASSTALAMNRFTTIMTGALTARSRNPLQQEESMRPLSQLTRDELLDTAKADIRNALGSLPATAHRGHIQGAQAHLLDALEHLALAEERSGPP